DGEDGRIKSAVGIGSLLEDGIGDTIRVSLTEDPEAEIPVAFAIGRRYAEPGAESAAWREPPFDPFHYRRRPTEVVHVGPEPTGSDTLPELVAAVASYVAALGVPAWGTAAALAGTDAILAAPALLLEQVVGEEGAEAAAGHLAEAVALADSAGRATVAALRASTTGDLIHATRQLAARLPVGVPILIVAPEGGPGALWAQLLDAAIGLGSPLCDGLG